ncbi:hypothetical protein DFH06DRAFT_1306780 [Mycena polygramma]|nr:hypothetical protein DFH06DRAFT_1306780 [Mycena polygramma]
MPSFAPDVERGIPMHAMTLSLPPNAFVPQDSAPSTPALEKDNVLSLRAAEKQNAPPLAFPKKKRTTSRWIRFQLWFNTYRKFFTFIVSLNLVALVLAATNTWAYPRRFAGAFVLGNLQCAILVRNELFGRFLYLLVNTLFAKWPPLWLRLGLTSALQHLGGVHTGCATSGAAWLVYRLVRIGTHYDRYPTSIVASGVVTTVAVFVSMASAIPWVRNTHHNIFEVFHRVVGWIGLISTWVFVVLGDSYNHQTHSWGSSGIRMISHQDFWFAVVMSIFVITPWLTVRRVPVQIELPSPKVAVLRFERGMQQGLLARISLGSQLEYHAFGTISKGKDSNEHYLICGVQGDFTKSLVQNPPTHMWTRQLKFAGVSNTTKIYKRGIRVCTGTGLGAALSSCLQSPDWYLIWIGSDQAKTFGPTISSLITDNLPPTQYCLWDSKERGKRPDIMKLIKETYDSWGAEVVFITSNMGGNTEMMEGCKKEGIPAFGTLWDF